MKTEKTAFSNAPTGVATPPKTRRTDRVFVSLGSNQGDRAAYLETARHRLAARSDIRVVRLSSVLENRALLYADQPDFLNQVLEIRTDLSPWDLLRFFKSTESDMGRKTRFRYGPREIDLDILSWEGLRLDQEELTLPHPGLRDRPYLHELLAELGESALKLADGELADGELAREGDRA